MYLKLALRNAKRSIFDYLLYIFSMIILTSIICISNCMANWGEMRVGFQTMSLPLLIVVIMVVLVNCINTFIVKQRAKEFATYMLLGMEKDKLALTFLGELSMIGILCYLLGVTFGAGICSVYFYNLEESFFQTLQQGVESKSTLGIIAKSIFQTFLYFCLVEVLSMHFMRQKVYKLQIVQLMKEKRRNQPLSGGRQKAFWGIMLITCFLGFLLLLFGIAFMHEQVMAAAISVIAIPVLLCVFLFYKWIYAFFASLRLSQKDVLYQGNCLYRIAEMTTGSKTGANINTVFCICLIFSAASFVCGMLFTNPDIHVFEQAKQKWMGFLQIGICMIFMVIYFSILSFLQMIDLKREARNSRLLFYMGKNQSKLKTLLCTQVLIKLLLPTVMCFITLWTAVPFVNYKLNSILPISMHNLLMNAVCGFMICFLVLYLCYYCVICIISLRYAAYTNRIIAKNIDNKILFGRILLKESPANKWTFKKR